LRPHDANEESQFFQRLAGFPQRQFLPERRQVRTFAARIALAELNPNAVTGLGSKMNTQEIVERFVNIEKRRLEPIQQRKDEKLKEIEAWSIVKAELDKLQEVVGSLDSAEIWEARSVESSNPDVVIARARRDAKPGKTVIAVDSVALSHQIASQGFETEDTRIGEGTVSIKVGDDPEDSPVTITLDEDNNTLEGLRRAINEEDAEVEAFIAKTHGDLPYRLLLTSKRTGAEGRISIEVNLNEENAPDFRNDFDRTSEWKGLDLLPPDVLERGGVGSSTPIIDVAGVYTGEDDIEMVFRVLKPGTIPSAEGVVLGWSDSLGREGQIEINEYNYAPGTPVEVVDGIQLRFSDGEVVGGDDFKVEARAARSPMLWWLNDADRAAKISKPTDWGSKERSGGIQVTGKYEGDQDQNVIFRVEGSGQVGGKKSLILHYEFSGTGERGQLDLSYPYQSESSEERPSDATAYDAKDGEALFDLKFNGESGEAPPTKLPIGNGLFVEIPPGVLRDGDTADIELVAPSSEDWWWLPDGVRGVTGEVDTKAEWRPFEDYDDEEERDLSRPAVEDGIPDYGANVSTAPIEISGEFIGDISKTYTFTVRRRGGVGITRALLLEWQDELGNKGVLNVGEGYRPGESIFFDRGLSLSLGRGDLYEGDSFEINTYTSTMRQAQDLVVRLGASDQGGGLEVRRSENKASDIIPGLDLEFLSSNKELVTVSVIGDTEKARERIRDFVDAYNTYQATSTEVSKFDKSTNTAAPLLSDRNLAQITNDLATTTIATVAGLPQSSNMLFSVGLRINDKGIMSLDEKKLSEKIENEYTSVANLFRSNGESDNPGVTFVGLGDRTRISPDGYKIDVSEVAKKGRFIGEPIPGGMIRVDDSNNVIVIRNNGRSSEPLELRKDVYTVSSLAKSIQKLLNEDKVLGRRGIQVDTYNGGLRFTSGSYGKSSSIEVEPGEKTSLDGLGLAGGTQENGQDVVGTIDGIEAPGRGQLLIGPDDHDSEGLRIYVSLTEKDLMDGPEASVTVTKGVAVKLQEKLQDINSPVDGKYKKFSQDLSEQLSSYDDQLKKMNERIDAKQQQLQLKFAKLDSTMGRLRSQQSYVSQQLSALGGANGGQKKDG
jgi:flagellar capping protein FliD